MLRLVLALLILCPALALAQPKRYELGQRLKAFELAWEKQTDSDARKRALENLPKLTPLFFSLQFGEAGRTLDEARWKLESKEAPVESQKWITSLYAMPEKMLYTTKDRRITVNIKHFYKMKTEMPKLAKVWIGFPGEERLEVSLEKLPVEISVPLPRKSLTMSNRSGDYFLQCEFIASGSAHYRKEIMVSILEPHMLKTDSITAIDPIAKATLLDYQSRIDSLSEGEIPETNVPAYRLHSIRRLISSTKDDYNLFSIHRDPIVTSDQFYLVIPHGKSSVVSLRLFTPIFAKVQDRLAKRPIVIALHGAGGSENLFFEGYGAGHIVKECERRGWFLIAPRSPISFTGNGPPVKAILDSLEKLFPIDRDEVFVVGHSMGAGQAIALAQANPKWYRGVAALGGGGRVSDAAAFGKLPVFVGVGDKDFALAGAKALHKSLAGRSVTYKEYPDLEHLLIVREALPDIFKQWDEIHDKRKDRVTN